MGKIKMPTWTRGAGLAKKARLGWFAHLKSSRTVRKIFTGAVPVFLVAFVAAFVASSIFAPAHSSDATTINATIGTSDYYIDITSSDVNIGVEAYPGDGRVSVAKTTVTTKTNAPKGYKLYLSMDPSATGTGLCLSGSSSECIDALPDALPTNLKTLEPNTWGYAVSSSSTGVPSTWTGAHSVVTNAVPSTVSQTFSAVPAAGSEQLIQSTSTSNTSGVGVDLFYGVRATIAKTTGTYSNTIAYTAVGDTTTSGESDLSFSPASYTRSTRYDDSKTGTATTQQVTIYTRLFTNMPSATTPTTAPTVTFYGGPSSSNRTFTCANPTQDVINNVLVVKCYLPYAYAATYNVKVEIPDYNYTVWGQYQYKATWSTISYMQEMTTDVCSEATQIAPGSKVTVASDANEVYLKDIRGGGGHLVRGGSAGAYTYTYQAGYNSAGYRVRRLADGNCWMTENMDYPQQTSQYYYDYDTNITTNSGSSYRYYTKTDVDSKTTVVYWRPMNNYITNSSLSSCPSGGPTDTTVTNDHTYYGLGSSCSTRTATTADSTSSTGQAAETQDIGTYYNWAAATARSGGDSGDAPNSVCPKGWRLPSGAGVSTGNKSFATLMNAYSLGNNSSGSTGARRYPLSYVFSGRYYWGSGTLYYQDSGGYWWSTAAYSGSNAYYLGMDSSNLGPQSNANKAFGFALRCVSL